MLLDPAHYAEEPQEYVIIEQKGTDGTPIGYFMDVPSVYCHDNVCKVVPVRIFWNPIGGYQRFELDRPYKLEKVKGKSFSRKDYQKLDIILHDRKSPFSGISIQEITKTSSSEGVDAVSGATTIVLDEKSTVRGATLTCYTLWMWANGEVTSMIRDLSGDQYSDEQFARLLLSNNETNVIFALEQLTRRKIYGTLISEAIEPVVAQHNQEYTKPLRRYLDGAPQETFFGLALAWFGQAMPRMRVEILQSVLASKYKADFEVCSELLELVKVAESYQEIDLLLRLLNKEGVRHNEIVESLLPLLDSNILIARRVYWYLSESDLPASGKNKLNEFEERNREYL